MFGLADPILFVVGRHLREGGDGLPKVGDGQWVSKDVRGEWKMDEEGVEVGRVVVMREVMIGGVESGLHCSLE